MALLRAADADIKNRDIQFAYETSFASEVFPGLAMSENSISDFLLRTGMEYRYLVEFMRKRAKISAGRNIVVDGMLKGCNSYVNTFSEFSRRGTKKGSKDISLIYAYDLETKEPVAVKPYPGNMLDMTSFRDFISEIVINRGLLVLDKGFCSKA